MAAMSLPAFATEAGADATSARHHVHHIHRHDAQRGVQERFVAVAPDEPSPVFAPGFPHIAPYPDGQGDEDGLSRDPNDCNKGCVGEP